jgi:hypothetical protein
VFGLGIGHGLAYDVRHTAMLPGFAPAAVANDQAAELVWRRTRPAVHVRHHAVKERGRRIAGHIEGFALKRVLLLNFGRFERVVLPVAAPVVLG